MICIIAGLLAVTMSVFAIYGYWRREQRNQKGILLSFDDYSPESWSNAFELFDEYGAKVTFFVTSEIFDDSLDLIKFIINSGHDVELASSDYDLAYVRKYNSIMKLISKDEFSFCLFDIKNESVLNNCKKEKLYSIIPSINDELFLYNEVKNNLKNGSIILIKNNSTAVRELPSVINYIFQKGKKIVSLKNLIKE